MYMPTLYVAVPLQQQGPPGGSKESRTAFVIDTSLPRHCHVLAERCAQQPSIMGRSEKLRMITFRL